LAVQLSASLAAKAGKASMPKEILWHGSGRGDKTPQRALERLEYPACPDSTPALAWDGWVEAGENSAEKPSADGAIQAGDHVVTANLEQHLAEQTRMAFESGREEGHEEGRRAERETQAPTAAADADRHRLQTLENVANLARERDNYLQAIEQEVVRLALAVAARILRREAQMDPLLLTGAVRVALGQVAATSEIRLRVPAREADLWRETIALLPNLIAKPLVVADETMLLGECVIESKAGTVDLGIRSQLGEIERGFFDRAGSSDAPPREAQMTAAPHTPAVETRA
jgi:flagellar biosynthesis/type III secretory pathway protein FliH